MQNTIERFSALSPEAQGRAIASLSPADQRKVFDGLCKLRDHVERTKFHRMFPDTGPHRRELYPKHTELIGLTADHRFVALLGGNGTGKTELGAYVATCHATGLYPAWWNGWRFDRPTTQWVAGDTKETVRDIIQRKLLGEPGQAGTGMVPAALLGKIVMRQNSNGSCDYVHVKHVSGRWSRIGFKSYDQRRESFQGVEQDAIWLDEECPPDIYQECVQRFRGKSAEGRLLLTFTPLSGITEVVSMFVPQFSTAFDAKEYGASNRAFVFCGWDDVPHLSAVEKAQKMANTLPHEREARTKGSPSIGSGKVYQVPESDFVIEPLQTIPKHWPRIYGADFGFSNDTAAVFMAHDQDADCVYLYAEYSRPQAEPDVHAGAIKAMGGTWIPGVGDYAGANLEGEKTLDVYKRLGLDIHNADKQVHAGVLDVMTRLSQGRLKVYSTCVKWLQEYRLYSRDDRGMVVKKNDHCLHPHTVVWTDRGALTIAELIGTTGRVLSAGGEWADYRHCRVTARNVDVVRVEFDDGSSVVCTPDHRFLSDRGWVQAKDMTGVACDDTISRRIHRDTQCLPKSYLQRLKDSTERLTTTAASIFSAMASGFTARCGNLRTARLLTGWPSTTLTRTAATTGLTIYASWFEASTPACTSQGMPGPFLSRRLAPLQSGTDRKKALRGIRSTTSCMAAGFMRLLSSLASNATRRLSRSLPEPIGFAQTHASLHGAESLDLMMLKRIALYAPPSSSAASTARKKLARANAAESFRCVAVTPAGKSDVICMEVPSTHAFAVGAGVVVHNCMDATRYAIRGLKRAKTKPIPKSATQGAGSVDFGFYRR